MTKTEILSKLRKSPARSAWDKGVKKSAIELVQNREADRISKCKTKSDLEKVLLNGASNWKHWCEGGSGLIWDEDIAERFCNSSELKRTDNGRKEPNAREGWMDVYARAMRHAWMLISKCC